MDVATMCWIDVDWLGAFCQVSRLVEGYTFAQQSMYEDADMCITSENMTLLPFLIEVYTLTRNGTSVSRYVWAVWIET